MRKRRASSSGAGPSSKKRNSVKPKRKVISELPSKEWKIATTGGFASSTTRELEERLQKHGVKILPGVDKKTSYLILGPQTTTNISFGRRVVTGVGSTRYLCAVRDEVPIMKESDLLPLLDQADLALAAKEDRFAGNKKKVPGKEVNKKKKIAKKVLKKKRNIVAPKKKKGTEKEDVLVDAGSDNDIMMDVGDGDEEDEIPLEVDSDDED